MRKRKAEVWIYLKRLESNSVWLDQHFLALQIAELTMEKDSGETTADQCKITKHVFTDLDKFLAAIHARFLENVEPIKSGLMHSLREDNVLGCDEEEEVRAEATRINKARKCWELLQAVQPAVFELLCFPALKKLYPHVLQEAVFSLDGARDADEFCLRRVIKATCLCGGGAMFEKV